MSGTTKVTGTATETNGGIISSNSFELTFDSTASAEIPGSSSVTAPTVPVLSKFTS